MDKIMLEKYIQYQNAEYDNDLIGMFLYMTEWLRIIRNKLDNKLPEIDSPEKYYKHDPHIPRMDARHNSREFLAAMVKRQKDDVPEDIQLSRLYVTILSIGYIFHMPISKLIEVSNTEESIDREEAKKILLEDGMSPNWIKEPSGTDYSALFT